MSLANIVTPEQILAARNKSIVKTLEYNLSKLPTLAIIGVGNQLIPLELIDSDRWEIESIAIANRILREAGWQGWIITYVDNKLHLVK